MNWYNNIMYKNCTFFGFQPTVKDDTAAVNTIEQVQNGK